MKSTANPARDISQVQRQGGDALDYSSALARRWGVSTDEARQIITAIGGVARVVDAETVAQERLAEDRRAAHESSSAWRQYQHEEE